jgi:hypothetical protein
MCLPGGKMTEELEFPERLPETFYKIADDVDREDIDKLAQSVKSYLIEAQKALYENEFIDIKSAEKLAATSQYLIEVMPSLSPEYQKLAKAAIKYFLESDDDEHDFESIFGFDDDVKVMNHVLDKIGHPEKKIEE